MKILFLITLFFPAAVSCFSQDKALFTIIENGKYGYIDDSGKIVITPKYESAYKFHEGLAAVSINGDWGYIDTAGKMLIKPQFFEARDFKTGIAKVGVFYKKRKIIDSMVGYYKYIDKNGNFTKEPESKKYYDGLSMFRTNGKKPDSKIGYVNENGKVVIKPQYDGGTEFSEGLACVYLGDNVSLIDTKGNVAFNLNSSLSSIFSMCIEFSEGLAAACRYDKDGSLDKCGYLDKTGKIIIEPQFSEVGEFSEGVAVVKEKDKSGYGVIDRTGRFIFPAKFGQIHKFRDGLAVVSLDGSWTLHGYADKWGYINKQGKIVWKSF